MNDFIKPRLYLITPPIEDGEAFASPFEAALASGDVACVLLRFAAPDEGSRKKIAKNLAAIAQSRDVALLVAEDSQLAARAGADGAHVTGLGENLEAALQSLKPSRIVGVGGLASRDEAMIAGESGVDYVLFGDLDSGGESAEKTLERAAWWAEIFQIPCVAVAHDLAEVGKLARSGCEFIALGADFFVDAQAIRAAQAAIDAAEAAA